MAETKRSKVVIGGIVTILLGAVGSGFWNVALGPALAWTGNVLLSAASFGIEATKNVTYCEIARGFHEQAAVTWLCTFSLFLMAIPFQCLFFYFFGRPIRKVLRRSITGTNSTPPRPTRTLLIICFVLLFSSSFFLVEYMFVAYSNRAITHFRQSFAICAPYMEDADEEEILAAFAKIRTKSDYVDVLERLSKVATNAGQELPSINAW